LFNANVISEVKKTRWTRQKTECLRPFAKHSFQKSVAKSITALTKFSGSFATF